MAVTSADIRQRLRPACHLEIDDEWACHGGHHIVAIIKLHRIISPAVTISADARHEAGTRRREVAMH